MRHTLVTYTVKLGREEENAALVRAGDGLETMHQPRLRTSLLEPAIPGPTDGETSCLAAFGRYSLYPQRDRYEAVR
jgi:hypothetical protein